MSTCKVYVIEKSGGPGQSRTGDKQFRKLLLYPSELRGQLELRYHLEPANICYQSNKSPRQLHRPLPFLHPNARACPFPPPVRASGCDCRTGHHDPCPALRCLQPRPPGRSPASSRPPVALNRVRTKIVANKSGKPGQWRDLCHAETLIFRESA